MWRSPSCSRRVFADADPQRFSRRRLRAAGKAGRGEKARLQICGKTGCCPPCNTRNPDRRRPVERPPTQLSGSVRRYTRQRCLCLGRCFDGRFHGVTLRPVSPATDAGPNCAKRAVGCRWPIRNLPRSDRRKRRHPDTPCRRQL